MRASKAAWARYLRGLELDPAGCRGFVVCRLLLAVVRLASHVLLDRFRGGPLCRIQCRRVLASKKLVPRGIDISLYFRAGRRIWPFFVWVIRSNDK
jgi:hypothetical protein